ncbi:MAG: fibronectin type III domain-containing protein [Actinobacteria bacterium]|nr:fibronectin type III domain-containing protein [Actinomycetota bacterium]
MTSYRIRMSTGSSRYIDGDSRSFTWTDLKKGKRYSFKVYAINDVGSSSGSSASSTVKIK